MRILLVEDNELIAQALQRGLRATYVVDVAQTARTAVSKIAHFTYDAILLDLQLPDGDGNEICRQLRTDGFSEPIIVLTGVSSVRTKVSLLDSGADDYITKPFSLEEVKARLRAALRRTGEPIGGQMLASNGIALNPASRTVSRYGVPVELRRKEFDILEYLLRNQGKTVTRSMIMSQIWERSDAVWANVVDVHVKHLRDKIDRPFDSQLIQTVHGVGYKLAPAESE